MARLKMILMTVMVLGFTCVPAWLQAEQSLPVIKKIRVFKSGEDLGVEISADKKFEYSCSKMPQLLKIVVDMPRTEIGTVGTLYKYRSVLISNIRLEKKNINDVAMTRVSVNLTEDADYTIRTDPSDNKKLTLLLRKTAAGSTAGTTAAVPRTGALGTSDVAKPAAPAAPAPKPVSKPVPPAAAAPKSPSRPVLPGAGQLVTVTGIECAGDAIDIRSSGSIGEFKTFTLQQPARLVIDIPGAQSTLRSIVLPANRFGVVKARVGIFEGKLRLVFDAGTKPFPRYEVLKTGTGLRIVSR